MTTASVLLGAVDQVAAIIGYAFLSVIALVVLLKALAPILSYVFWNRSSDEAKQIGAMAKKEHGHDSGMAAAFAQMMIESIDDISPDAHIEYDPSPVATLDWSIDDPDSLEINLMKSALEDAGFFVHPFPQERDGEWSIQHVGVWHEEPTWYIEDTLELETEDETEVRRIEVTPDV